jgi:hypothetical protein
VRRKKLLPTEPSKFTEEALNKLQKDLQSGRLPMNRIQVSDDMVTGLRAMVTKDGDISYHCAYNLGDSRPFIKIGTAHKGHPEHITIETARYRARTIKALGNRGIDVQDGLYRRLFQELDRDGEAWKPALAPPAKK